MPALNFQARFAPLVESGKKCQTVRAMRKRPFKEGDTLYLYTGQRTKGCRLLIKRECTGSFDVEFNHNGQLLFFVDGKNVIMDRDTFAKCDGFDSWAEMLEWFAVNHGLPFHGQVIYW
jgi:hypothetical protein